MRHYTCHEEVTRRGQVQPCDLPAVALRQDPETSAPYPVCTKHTRTSALMVPLDIIAEANYQLGRDGASHE